MSNVPQRFLGYAFCVGDLLLELDADLVIKNADGALSLLKRSEDVSLVNRSISDFFKKSDSELLAALSSRLQASGRIGPFSLSLASAKKAEKTLTIFLSKLPMYADRLYMVVTKPYRFSVTEKSSIEDGATASNARHTFMDKMIGIFSSDTEAEQTLLVSILEGTDPSNTSTTSLNLETYLSKISIGGNHASKLTDNRFALVHEKKDGDANQAALSLQADIKSATGIDFDIASIDAQENALSDTDNLRALAYSLQRFAAGEKDFSVSNIAKNKSAILGSAREKVKKFRDLLAHKRFSLVYQPIVNLKTKETSHFEALSRFDSNFTDMTAFDIISFAEEVGLIGDYDLAVLDRVIEKLRITQRSAKSAPPKLAVNISGRSLSSPDFLETFETKLWKARDLVPYLIVEITESARIDDLLSLSQKLSQIRTLGFKVYLDDFGAGASGFHYLKHMEVDAIKIDGQYIKDALNNKSDRAFLKAMVGLCHDLGILTVGEWVETDDQAAMLEKIGINFGQGYYFGKPNTGIYARKLAV